MMIKNTNLGLRVICLLTPLLLCSQALFAQDVTPADWPARISAAIDRFEQNALQEWAFCLASSEHEEGELTSSTECFDPSLPLGQQWQLRLKNGQYPSAAEQRSYLKTKQQQAKKGKSFNLTLKLSRLVLHDTVQFVNEDASHWYGRFQVHIEKLGAAASKQLHGQLRFNKAGNFIEQIEITNSGPLAVMLGTKIEHFRLQLDFIELEHAVLQHQQQMTMQGTFAFVTAIDEVSQDVFSDFRYVGVVASAAATATVPASGQGVLQK